MKSLQIIFCLVIVFLPIKLKEQHTSKYLIQRENTLSSTPKYKVCQINFDCYPNFTDKLFYMAMLKGWEIIVLSKLEEDIQYPKMK